MIRKNGLAAASGGARGLTGRHGKANCNVVPLTLLHIELDLLILIWLYFKIINLFNCCFYVKT